MYKFQSKIAYVIKCVFSFIVVVTIKKACFYKSFSYLYLEKWVHYLYFIDEKQKLKLREDM